MNNLHNIFIANDETGVVVSKKCKETMLTWVESNEICFKKINFSGKKFDRNDVIAEIKKRNLSPYLVPGVPGKNGTCSLNYESQEFVESGLCVEEVFKDGKWQLVVAKERFKVRTTEEKESNGTEFENLNYNMIIDNYVIEK